MNSESSIPIEYILICGAILIELVVVASDVVAYFKKKFEEV